MDILGTLFPPPGTYHGLLFVAVDQTIFHVDLDICGEWGLCRCATNILLFVYAVQISVV